MGNCSSKQSSLVAPSTASDNANLNNKKQTKNHSDSDCDNNIIDIQSNETKVNPINTAVAIDAIVSSSGLVYNDAVDNSSNLFSAIKQGNIQLVKDLINNYHNVNIRSSTDDKCSINRLLGMIILYILHCLLNH